MSFESRAGLFSMAIKNVTPYLMFNGTAEKAIRLYEKALGAKTEHLQRFGEIPNSNPSPDSKDRIIHALLRLGENMLMISDCQPADVVQTGDSVHVCVDFDDETDMKKKFDALAADGKVTVAVHDTFWGAKFGMLVDPFGVNWMFNCSKET
jgi:PhnB protein